MKASKYSAVMVLYLLTLYEMFRSECVDALISHSHITFHNIQLQWFISYAGNPYVK
jgi:hypothetical protein